MIKEKELKVLCINANGLHNDGITNSILTYYSNMDKSDMQIDMLKTKDIDSITEKKALESGVNLRFTSYRKNVLPYIIKTAQLIKKEKYDIVHIHGSSALLTIDLLAAFWGGCKVRIVHSRNTKCDHTKIDKLLRPLFYSLCTERFACGEEAGRWLFNNKKFKIIKNAKNLDKYSYNEDIRNLVRDKYQLNGKTVYGHVGNFNYQKNHEFLILLFSEIVKKNKESVLVLMGTGTDYLEKAKKQVENLNLEDKVIFLGSINNVEELLQGMDIMLFPSYFEGLPNVVLEWQISGVPSIISSNITRECWITNLVSYVSITEGVEPWIEEIEKVKEGIHNSNRKMRSIKAKIALKNEGFDIIECAALLKQYYIDALED